MAPGARRCDLCCDPKPLFSKRANMNRHGRQQHGLKGAELAAYMAGIHDNVFRCRECGKCVVNLSRHKKTLSHRRKKAARLSRSDQTVVKPPPDSGEDSDDDFTLNRQKKKRRMVLDSSDESSEESVQNTGQDEADDQEKTSQDFFKEFQEFCLSDVGNIKQSSHKLYEDKLRSFEAYQVGKDENFNLGRLVSMQNTGYFRELPECTEWVSDQFSEISSKEMALNAYKKMLQMLKRKVCTVEFKVGREESTLRTGWLERRNTEACLLAKSIGSKREKEKSMKQWEKSIEAATSGEMQPIPLDELKRVATEYRNSDWRKNQYSKLLDMTKALASDDYYTPWQIRDFCLCDAYIEAGGLRPDSLLNMTCRELFNAEPIEASDSHEHAIRVNEHKTSGSGAARVILAHPTLQLIKNYVKVVRPKICGEDELDDESFVFPTTSGRRLQSMKHSFKWFVKQVNSEFRILPYDFRRLLATLGQASDDAIVREKFPACMNQSRTTAERFYVSETYKKETHAKLKTQLWGSTSNLPAREQCAEDIAIKKAINKKTKAKKQALMCLKKSRNFVPRKKCFFSPAEAEIIKKTFDHLVYDDGSRIGNLSSKEYKLAYEKCSEFKAMVDRRAKYCDKGHGYVEQAVKNSYRWHCAVKLTQKKTK